MSGKWASSTVLFLLAVPRVFAQQHTLEVSQYLQSSWTAQEGFFKPGVSGIYSISQTSDGYLWVPGTAFLLRFDGVRFYEWKPPATDSLQGKPFHQGPAMPLSLCWLALRSYSYARVIASAIGYSTACGLCWGSRQPSDQLLPRSPEPIPQRRV